MLLVLPISAQTRNRTVGSSTKKTTTTTKAAVKTPQKKTVPQKKTTPQKVDKKTQLRNEKAAAQKARQQSQAQLAQLNKNVKASLDSVLILDHQIGKQQQSIDSLNKDIVSLGSTIDTLNLQLAKLQKDLEIKKKRYAKAMVYLRRNKSVQNKLMFVFSADNFTQMVRRFRYMQEYSTFQKAQGELLKEKQLEVKAKQNELLAAKAQKEQNLQMVEAKKKSLQGMKTNCQTQVDYLNKNGEKVGLLSVHLYRPFSLEHFFIFGFAGCRCIYCIAVLICGVLGNFTVALCIRYIVIRLRKCRLTVRVCGLIGCIIGVINYDYLHTRNRLIV